MNTIKIARNGSWLAAIKPCLLIQIYWTFHYITDSDGLVERQKMLTKGIMLPFVKLDHNAAWVAFVCSSCVVKYPSRIFEVSVSLPIPAASVLEIEACFPDLDLVHGPCYFRSNCSWASTTLLAMIFLAIDLTRLLSHSIEEISCLGLPDNRLDQIWSWFIRSTKAFLQFTTTTHHLMNVKVKVIVFGLRWSR